MRICSKNFVSSMLLHFNIYLIYNICNQKNHTESPKVYIHPNTQPPDKYIQLSMSFRETYTSTYSHSQPWEPLLTHSLKPVHTCIRNRYLIFSTLHATHTGVSIYFPWDIFQVLGMSFKNTDIYKNWNIETEQVWLD